MHHFVRPHSGLWLIIGWLFMSSTLNAANETPMVIKISTTRELIAGQSYKFDLSKLILDATKAEYGDYRFEYYLNSPSASRQAILLKQGDLINLLWGSAGTAANKVGAIMIPYDLYRGLLGRRICIINSHNKLLFNSITNANALKSIRIGQGVDWPDIEIYKFNNITTIQAPSFEGMFGMLTLNRFDCIALGVTEIDQFYHENFAQFPSLQIEKNLLLYYDLPIYMYISPQYPRIAERLKKGLQKILANGEFDRLFARYFHDNITALNLQARRVICLKSPYFPLDKQCQHIEQINNLDEQRIFPPL